MADLNPFLNDPMYGLTEQELGAVYDAPLNGATADDGARFAWAISQSGNLLAYNATWSADLGFDGPPTTSAEF